MFQIFQLSLFETNPLNSGEALDPADVERPIGRTAGRETDGQSIFSQSLFHTSE